jgi:hypothetical protein
MLSWTRLIGRPISRPVSDSKSWTALLWIRLLAVLHLGWGKLWR